MTTISDWIYGSRSAIVSHLWQSSAVGLAILGLLALGLNLSARTRRALAWVALVKFAIPAAVIGSLAERLTNAFGGSMKFGQLPLSAMLPSGMWMSPVYADAAAGRGFWTLAGCVWAVGFAFLLGVWTIRGKRLRRRLVAPASPLEDGLLESAKAAARRMGLQAPPPCLSVETGHGPGVLGVISPIVILPRGIEAALLPEELEAILVHEFVHVSRRDPWWNFLQMLLVSAFWFNPVVWLLQRRLNVEAEKSCDDRVLEITAAPDTYASGILKTVRLSIGLPQIGFASAAMPPVASRLKQILSGARRPERALVRVAMLGAGATLMALSGYSGSVDLDANRMPEAGTTAPVSTDHTTVLSTATSPADSASVEPNRTEVVYPYNELDQKPTALAHPWPRYPAEMKKAGISGQVVVGFVVGSNGVVRGAHVVSSTRSEFEAAAVDAVGKWHFIAGQKSGRAVNVAMRAPIVFSTKPAEIGVPPGQNPSEIQAPKLPPPNEIVRMNPMEVKAGAAQAASDEKPLSLEVNPSPGTPGYSIQVFDVEMLDKCPLVTYQKRPAYPYNMKKEGVSAEVVVAFLVDTEGAVRDVHAVKSRGKSSPLSFDDASHFERAAISAVSQWQFKPGEKAGHAVYTRMQIPIVFSLEN